MPEKGRIAIYDSSWYRKVLIDRFEKKVGEKEVLSAYDLSLIHILGMISPEILQQLYAKWQERLNRNDGELLKKIICICLLYTSPDGLYRFRSAKTEWKDL